MQCLAGRYRKHPIFRFEHLCDKVCSPSASEGIVPAARGMQRSAEMLWQLAAKEVLTALFCSNKRSAEGRARMPLAHAACAGTGTAHDGMLFIGV